VSLPDEAAFTICCSTDLFILALSACITIQLSVIEKTKREGGNRNRK
jgi:hypothetical protein